jgi:SAM-dependent methyltransferase
MTSDIDPKKIVSKIADDESIKDLLRSIGKGVEFEIRFGINDGTRAFVPNVGYDLYKKIQDFAKKKNKTNNINSINDEISISMFNTNSNSDYRVNRYYSPSWDLLKVEKMKKKTLKKVDFDDYGIRFSLAYEEDLGEDYVEELEIDKIKNKFRFRKRESYMLNSQWRLDITISRMIETIKPSDVREWKDAIVADLANDTHRENFNYEIELEYIPNNKTDSKQENLISALSDIYSIIVSSQSTINTQIRIGIFQQLKKIITNTTKFNYIPIDKMTIKDLSNQVITMEIKDLNTIMQKEYTVTEKTDGERMLLWINNNNGFFITSANEIRKVHMKNSVQGTFLLDGEFLSANSQSEKMNQDLFLVFDALVSRGMNITNLQFPKRQKHAEDIIGTITLIGGDLVIAKKIFYEITEETFFQKNKTVIDTPRNYDIDGLIYTPGTGTYFDPIYKWKMQHTIDFIIKKIHGTGSGSGSDWNVRLYLRATKGDFARNKWVVPDFYKKDFPNIDIDNAEVFPFPFMPEKDSEKWYNTKISKKEVAKFEIEDNTIVEFYWTGENWKVYGTRPDRTAIYRLPNNTTFYGNAFLTGVSIYNAIIHPITERMIRGEEPIPQGYWRSGDKSLIKAMLLFHSNIKITLYTKYAKNAPAILELGGGHANDFKKWVKAGIQSVTLIDPDAEAIAEAKSRTRGIREMQIEYIIGSAAQNIPLLLEKNTTQNRKFNSIFANFSVHYFATNKEEIKLLIENVSEMLVPGGYFVCTTFAGDRVFDALAKNNPITINADSQKDKVLFSIEAKYQTSDKKFKHYGQKIEVFVESIGVKHEETLMNLQYFINKFCETEEFTLVENTPFENFLDTYEEKNTLTNAEKRYSLFNNAVVFKKI